ncbi:MAG: hypothetical protein QM784_28160 [Polyangiaceae bacterium]
MVGIAVQCNAEDCRLAAGIACDALAAQLRQFVRPWGSNLHRETPLACTQCREVRSGLCERQTAIGALTNNMQLNLVLAVILPEADRADLVRAPLVKRQVATTGAGVSLSVDMRKTDGVSM